MFDRKSITRLWRGSKYHNLRVYVPSGTYHIFATVNGKLLRESTGTEDATKAQQVRDRRISEERAKRAELPHESIADVCDKWLKRFQEGQSSPETKKYKREQVNAILETWPDFEQKVYQITRKDCDRWAEAFAERFGSTRFNGGVQVIRSVLGSAGCDTAALLKGIEFKSIKPRKAVIPSRDEFQRIVEAIRNQPLHEPQSPLMVQLIAQSGMRSKEIRASRVEHVNWKNNKLKILGAKGRGGEPKVRYLPIHPALATTLHEVIGARTDGPLFSIKSIRRSLRTACKTVGCAQITTHDLRDIFVTTCIESDVDFHTLAEWVGHNDGGALLAKTYAHLRDEHSQLMAKRVKF